MLAEMRHRYGLDRSWPVQYWHWISGVVEGDFGYSFKWQQPVSSLIGERMGLTLVLSFATLLFTWAIAFVIPYAAVFLAFVAQGMRGDWDGVEAYMVSPAEARSLLPFSRHSMRKRPPDGHWTRPIAFRLRATLPQPLDVLTRRRMLTRATAPLLEKVDTIIDTTAWSS